mmetsp:Transcript_9196/g.19811  ORF Transcript_9196/g.19811 Transcript_9196/m.19811 type:complete len:244 (-) Transcript_9196:126-857(-)
MDAAEATNPAREKYGPMIRACSAAMVGMRTMGTRQHKSVKPYANPKSKPMSRFWRASIRRRPACVSGRGGNVATVAASNDVVCGVLVPSSKGLFERRWTVRRSLLLLLLPRCLWCCCDCPPVEACKRVLPPRKVCSAAVGMGRIEEDDDETPNSLEGYCGCSLPTPTGQASANASVRQPDKTSRKRTFPQSRDDLVLWREGEWNAIIRQVLLFRETKEFRTHKIFLSTGETERERPLRLCWSL